MARFRITSEHTREEDLARIRTFAKGKGIKVTSAKMDALFTGHAHVIVSCETKRGANTVRDFIWNEVNSGCYCEITKLAEKKKVAVRCQRPRLKAQPRRT